MESLSESELFNASVLPMLEERLHKQVRYVVFFQNSVDLIWVNILGIV